MFEWDENKNKINTEKHDVSFEFAKEAFNDPNHLILADESHSLGEDRYFCIGEVDGAIITVRFVVRGEKIRIIGAGYWRKGRKLYESRH